MGLTRKRPAPPRTYLSINMSADWPIRIFYGLVTAYQGLFGLFVPSSIFHQALQSHLCGALRHTVGMRLRLANVYDRTQDEILWHSKRDMTSHYAVAQVREIYTALESIKKEGGFEESLNLMALVRRAQVKSIDEGRGQVTQNLPKHKKTA